MSMDETSRHVQLDATASEHRIAQSPDSSRPGAKFFDGFLPRSQSRAVFLFVMTCYSFTLQSMDWRFTRLLGFSPAMGLEHRTAAAVSEVISPLVVAPVLESLAVIGLIELLRWLNFSVFIQIVVSASVSCLLHSIPHPIGGFLVAPAFFIFAGTYIYWRRVSFWVGSQMIILLHFLYNAIVFMGVLAQWLHG